MRLTPILLFIVLISVVIAHGQDTGPRSRDYRKADSVANLYPHHSLDNLRLLSDKLTSPLKTEEEKFRSIYTWVCLNIDNDYSMYLKNKRNKAKAKNADELKAWRVQFSEEVFRELRVNYRTVCAGYAYLVRELSSFAGIESKIIEGYGRNVSNNVGGSGVVNHSWNAVLLNGEWYLCDPTWSSGAIDTKSNTFVKNFDDSYFLADPGLFVRNHYPIDTAWIMLPSKPTLEIFLNRPIIYINAYHYRVTPVSPDNFNIVASKGDEMTFSFRKNGGKTIGKVELHLETMNTNDLIKIGQEDAFTIYSVAHTFKTRGKYALHILIDDNYVFSYDVTVR